MKAFTQVTAKALPLDRPNVDTDAIIPKQYLKSIKRTGFGPFLFDDWRYLDPGTLDVDPATRRLNPTSCSTMRSTPAPRFCWRATISAVARRASTPCGRWTTRAFAP